MTLHAVKDVNTLTKSSWAGHRNYRTVKGVSFAGSSDEYIVSGSDDGHIYIWSRDGLLRQWLEGDNRVVNCIEPHPQLPLVMATSGKELQHHPIDA